MKKKKEARLLKQPHKVVIKRSEMSLMMCLEIRAIKHLMQSPPVGKRPLNESIRQPLFSLPGHKWKLICIKCFIKTDVHLKGSL